MRYTLLFVIAVAPASVVAQESAFDLVVEPAAKAPRLPFDENALYEDIEIMCRTLGKEIGANTVLRAHTELLGLNYYGRIGRGGELALDWHRGRIKFSGLYLASAGVVITADAPAAQPAFPNQLLLRSSCANCHMKGFEKAALPKTQLQQLTEWEKMRLQLRGKPIPQPKRTVTPVCQPGNLTSRLIELMFKHGHNMKYIPNGESLTIAINIPAAGRKPTRSVGTRTMAEVNKRLAAATEDAALGDLHVRNKKYDLAIKAFEKALANFQNIPEPPDKQGPVVQKKYRDIAQKLIKAHIDRGEIATAQAAIDKHEKGVKFTKPKAIPAASRTRANLPSKLILSVTREDMLDAQKNKRTLKEFSAKVNVKTINFPKADAKPRGKKSINERH